MYIDIKHRTCTCTCTVTTQFLYLKSAYDTKFYICLFERAFKMMKNGVYFIVSDSSLGCRVIQDFDLCKLDDL